MDSIVLQNMQFYGYHGVLAEEKTLGQKFFVDARLAVDLKPAGRSDDVADTVSYAEVYGLVEAIVTGERFDLLEALAQRIATDILREFDKVQSVEVAIRKPGAPVKGHFDWFAVEIIRSREAHD